MSVFFDKDGFLGRLEKLRIQAGLTKGEFSQRVGVAQIFSRYAPPKPGGKERKIKAPSTETLIRISNEFNASVDWLLTGKEPTPAAPPQLTIQTVPRFKRFAKSFAFEEYIPIRLLGGSVAGGAPSEVREEDIAGWALIYASRDWMPTDPENYTCVHVNGKSMYPVLTDGDIVAIDHSEKDPAKLDGKMVAFRVNGGATIKWLKYDKNEGVVVGVPENKDEIDHLVILKGNEINEGIVGLVRWWWAKR